MTPFDVIAPYIDYWSQLANAHRQMFGADRWSVKNTAIITGLTGLSLPLFLSDSAEAAADRL